MKNSQGVSPRALVVTTRADSAHHILYSPSMTLQLKTLVVHEYVRLILLKQDHNIVGNCASSIFEHDSANLSPSCLLGRSIPNKTFIRAALKAVGQAILDGVQAVH